MAITKKNGINGEGSTIQPLQIDSIEGIYKGKKNLLESYITRNSTRMPDDAIRNPDAFGKHKADYNFSDSRGESKNEINTTISAHYKEPQNLTSDLIEEFLGHNSIHLETHYRMDISDKLIKCSLRGHINANQSMIPSTIYISEGFPEDILPKRFPSFYNEDLKSSLPYTIFGVSYSLSKKSKIAEDIKLAQACSKYENKKIIEDNLEELFTTATIQTKKRIDDPTINDYIRKHSQKHIAGAKAEGLDTGNLLTILSLKVIAQIPEDNLIRPSQWYGLMKQKYRFEK